MRTKTTTGICVALIAMAIGASSVWAAKEKAAPETPLTEAGRMKGFRCQESGSRDQEAGIREVNHSLLTSCMFNRDARAECDECLTQRRQGAEDLPPIVAMDRRLRANNLLLATIYYLLNCQRTKRRDISSPGAIVANCGANSSGKNGHPSNGRT